MDQEMIDQMAERIAYWKKQAEWYEEQFDRSHRIGIERDKLVKKLEDKIEELQTPVNPTVFQPIVDGVAEALTVPTPTPKITAEDIIDLIRKEPNWMGHQYGNALLLTEREMSDIVQEAGYGTFNSVRADVIGGRL